MVAIAPDLPTRFPCWCRAVYSWGGETKRDLGFVEGDLIECLNAGDGSWWMGRLKRDRRVAGLFPSNFVRVLEDDFRPHSRATSPAVTSPNGGSLSRAASPMPANGNLKAPSPQPQKTPSKSFRKPFQAYARAPSPNPAALSRSGENGSRATSPIGNSLSHHPSRPCSRMNSQDSRGVSSSRAPSPSPLFHQTSRSRAPSPALGHDAGPSPPPPAPPPHRVLYSTRNAPSPAPSRQEWNSRKDRTSRQPSPTPTPARAMGATPSPLRDAIDEVMWSLNDMGVSHESTLEDRSHTPPAPWSPDAIEQTHSHSSPRKKARPVTSLGIGGRGPENDMGGSNDTSACADNDEEAPYLSSYVARMESRLKRMHQSNSAAPDELFLPTNGHQNSRGSPPAVPPKAASDAARSHSSLDRRGPGKGSTESHRRLRARKSAYELGRQMLGRTFTVRSNATSSSSGAQSNSTAGSNSTGLTGQSVMSGPSAGGFSATSAGSFARRNGVPGICRGRPVTSMETSRPSASRSGVSFDDGRPQSPFTGVTYHSSHDSRSAAAPQTNGQGGVSNADGILGGLTAPKPKKSGFLKKIMESAKTGAASARSSIAMGQATPPQSPLKSMIPNGVTSIGGGSAAKDMGLGGSGGTDWVQVRRDVNRSNSLSLNERAERQERCQMMDFPVISPVDELFEATEGDEGFDGHPIDSPIDYQTVNLSQVDKGARFINSIPPMTNPASLAQGYVCRPYRSDVQKLRAIFTWVSEKVAWEEDFEGEVDSRRVIQTKRGCAQEVAFLVLEMCTAVGLHAEVVRGHLKTPGDQLELDCVPSPNHWWNAVIVDGAWRIMDCSLASPTNPKRGQYSCASPQVAESWWFLSRPVEVCYTHVALAPEQQHLCPPLPYDILVALPCACPPYFRNALRMFEYDTSRVRIEELELVHLQFAVPYDVECVAEVEARAFQQDLDGDFFESGEVVRKRALAQAEWVGGQKKYTVKALLPGDEGQGTLKVYAGKRGLMHSIKDNPHPLAFAVPIHHVGNNPPYDFLTRYPTPHAQRHDLYVAQPQCARLAINNTFVFAIRQHPSSLSGASPNPGAASPVPMVRPSSAMSMTSSSASGSGTGSSYAHKKPAKLAIQAPSGKILRLMRKGEGTFSTSGPGGGEAGDGGIWETIIKCGERGIWRGLVLADRSARWCVFAEWTCV
ncbi:MAG: cytokinesis protein 3 [Piccolia ochrophora]|nr:MAG: cytokinesis protein 3 [Piccolia ochrophora]